MIGVERSGVSASSGTKTPSESPESGASVAIVASVPPADRGGCRLVRPAAPGETIKPDQPHRQRYEPEQADGLRREEPLDAGHRKGNADDQQGDQSMTEPHRAGAPGDGQQTRHRQQVVETGREDSRDDDREQDEGVRHGG